MTTESRDAPQAAGVHSLWRLRGYLRPYVWSLSLMLVASLGGVALAIGIPLVTRAIIDGPTRQAISVFFMVLPFCALLLCSGAFNAAIRATFHGWR